MEENKDEDKELTFKERGEIKLNNTLNLINQLLIKKQISNTYYLHIKTIIEKIIEKLNIDDIDDIDDTDKNFTTYAFEYFDDIDDTDDTDKIFTTYAFEYVDAIDAINKQNSMQQLIKFVKEQKNIYPELKHDEFEPVPTTDNYNIIIDNATLDVNYSLIITHNYRIKCLLNKLFGLRIVHNFKPSCLLKITVDKQINEYSNAKVELLHSGETEKEDSKIYYVTKKDKQPMDVKFRENRDIGPSESRVEAQSYLANLDIPIAEHPLIKNNDKSIEFDDILPNTLPTLHEMNNDKTHIFYITRNCSDVTQFNHHMRQDLDLNGGLINNIFVSDLYRTRRTYDLLQNLIDRSKKPYKLPEAIVLPCSHEITRSVENGNCDEITSMFDKSALNNYPNCTINKLNKDSKCHGNWNYYKEFYGNQMRNSIWKKTRRCRDTIMIVEAINIIEHPQTGGSKKRKRKTRRKNNLYIMDCNGKLNPSECKLNGKAFGGSRKTKQKRTRKIKR